MSHPDETQALIDFLFDPFAKRFGDKSINQRCYHAAIVLARDHAIVERVTALHERYRKVYWLYVNDLGEALTPPAEQPPRSESIPQRTTSDDAPSDGPNPIASNMEAAPQGGQIGSETPVVAKCDETSEAEEQAVTELWNICANGITKDNVRMAVRALIRAAEQPKPSPDRSVVSAYQCKGGKALAGYVTAGGQSVVTKWERCEHDQTYPHAVEQGEAGSKERTTDSKPDRSAIVADLRKAAISRLFEAMMADDPESCLEHCTEYVDAAAKLAEVLG